MISLINVFFFLTGTSMIDYAKDVLKQDENYIDKETMFGAPLSHSRLMNVENKYLSRILRIFQKIEKCSKDENLKMWVKRFENKDLIDTENKKEIVNFIFENHNQLSEEQRKTLAKCYRIATGMRHFNKSHFIPWCVDQRKWKLPYAPHILARKVMDDELIDDKAKYSYTGEVKGNEKSSSATEYADLGCVAGLTNQCFEDIHSLKTGTYFETTKLGVVDTLVTFDGVAHISDTDLMPQIMSTNTSTVMLSWSLCSNRYQKQRYDVMMTIMKDGGDYTTYGCNCDESGKLDSDINDSIPKSRSSLMLSEETNVSSGNSIPIFKIVYESSSKLSDYTFDINGEKRMKKSSKERLNIIHHVNKNICSRMNEVIGCIHLRKVQYSQAYKLIESVASDKFRSRSIEGESSDTIIKQFQQDLYLCRITNDSYYSYYKYITHEKSLKLTSFPPTSSSFHPPSSSSSKKKKKNYTKEKLQKENEFNKFLTTIKELNTINPHQQILPISSLVLFERHPKLGEKLIAALASDVTKHVPLFATIINSSLKDLSTRLKNYISTLPYRALTKHTNEIGRLKDLLNKGLIKAEECASKLKRLIRSSVELIEAAIELKADITLIDILYPNFMSEKNDFQNSLEIRTECLKLLLKTPGYQPKDYSDLMNSNLISIALSRNETPIIELLSKAIIVPKLDDLLNENYPVNESATSIEEWERKIQSSITNNKTVYNNENDYYVTVKTDSIWKIQDSKHSLMTNNRKKLLINYLLNEIDEECELNLCYNGDKNRLGDEKMSELLMGADESYTPWFNYQSRIFSSIKHIDHQDEEDRYILNSDEWHLYCEIGMYNYITQAFIDGNIELISLYLSKGAHVSERGHIHPDIFLQLEDDFPGVFDQKSEKRHLPRTKFPSLSLGPYDKFMKFTVSENEVKAIHERLKLLLKRPDGDNGTDWSEIGITPMHVFLSMPEDEEEKDEKERKIDQKDNVNIKELMMNTIESTCYKYINVDKFYSKDNTNKKLTIQMKIDELSDENIKDYVNKFIKRTNNIVLEKGQRKKREAKKMNNNNNKKKQKGKKGIDKAISKKGKKDRDEEYEKVISSFMKYDTKILYIENVQLMDQLNDLSVPKRFQAQRGQIKTSVHGQVTVGRDIDSSSWRGSGETKRNKDETKDEARGETKRNFVSYKYNKFKNKVDPKTNENYSIDLKDLLSSNNEDDIWEINATDEFRKWYYRFSNKKPVFRNRLIEAITQLRKGDWKTDKGGTGNSIAKQLTNLGCGCKLYEMKFNESKVRVYWELKIDRSTKHSTNEKDVYTDIILLRSGGPKKRQPKLIQSIIDSYNKKEHIILRKKLKKSIGGRRGVKYQTNEIKDVLNRPAQYYTIDDEDEHKHSRGEHLMDKVLEDDDKSPYVIQVQGPALPNKTDFGMQLTYMWGPKDMMSHTYMDHIPHAPPVLDPEENKIISLNIDSSILLLGRSGTGKTTCLVSRIFNDYCNYWENIGCTIERNIIDKKLSIQRYQSTLEYKKLNDIDKDKKNIDLNKELKLVEKDHEHYLFITKSPGLRWEIRESFRKLRETKYFNETLEAAENATEYIKLHPNVSYDEALELFPLKYPSDLHPENPNQFIWSLNRYNIDDNDHHPGVKEECWPMFLAEHEWLHILDHTLPINKKQSRFRAFYDHFDDENDDKRKNDELYDNDELYAHDNNDRSSLYKDWFWKEAKPPPSSSTDDNDDVYDDGSMKKINCDARKVGDEQKGYIEITYDIFVEMIYPKFKNKKEYNSMNADASLIFSEIKSHIQGSFQALESKNGHISKEEYLNFGKKRSRLTKEERSIIYDFYVNEYKYIRDHQHYITTTGQRLGYWDLSQIVYNLYYRFQNSTLEERNQIIPINKIFIDEVQDFTQAELSLIILICKNPNALFFAGDTAQNIEKGVSFRFEEIKSLFHNLEQRRLKYKRETEKREKEEIKKTKSENTKISKNDNDEVAVTAVKEETIHRTKNKKYKNDGGDGGDDDNNGETKEEKKNIDEDEAIITRGWDWRQIAFQVPDEKKGTFKTLTTNYRSHSGVLNLAGTVVELLYWKFPLSLDKLPSDRGIEKQENHGLPVIFKQGKVEELEVVLSGKKGGKIDFGVGQAILLRSQKNKNELPIGLRNHPNIFSITGSKGLEFDDVLLFNFFTNSKVSAKIWRALANYNDEEAEIQIKKTIPLTLNEYLLKLNKSEKIHPTEFNDSEHRVLENELKDLYIAITRAKKNVWIFDADLDNNYFTFNAQTLYQLFDRRGLVQMYDHTSDPMSFQNSSSPEEWSQAAYKTLIIASKENNMEIKIEKIKRAALAYRKGNCVHEANRSDAYACELSAKFQKNLTPAKKQKLFYEAIKYYSLCTPPYLKQMTECLEIVADMEGVPAHQKSGVKELIQAISSDPITDISMNRTITKVATRINTTLQKIKSAEKDKEREREENLKRRRDTNKKTIYTLMNTSTANTATSSNNTNDNIKMNGRTITNTAEHKSNSNNGKTNNNSSDNPNNNLPKRNTKKCGTISKKDEIRIKKEKQAEKLRKKKDEEEKIRQEKNIQRELKKRKQAELNLKRQERIRKQREEKEAQTNARIAREKKEQKLFEKATAIAIENEAKKAKELEKETLKKLQKVEDEKRKKQQKIKDMKDMQEKLNDQKLQNELQEELNRFGSLDYDDDDYDDYVDDTNGETKGQLNPQAESFFNFNPTTSIPTATFNQFQNQRTNSSIVKSQSVPMTEGDINDTIKISQILRNTSNQSRQQQFPSLISVPTPNAGTEYMQKTSIDGFNPEYEFTDNDDSSGLSMASSSLSMISIPQLSSINSNSLLWNNDDDDDDLKELNGELSPRFNNNSATTKMHGEMKNDFDKLLNHYEPTDQAHYGFVFLCNNVNQELFVSNTPLIFGTTRNSFERQEMDIIDEGTPIWVFNRISKEIFGVSRSVFEFFWKFFHCQ
jgi:hypothetical protein